MRIFRQKGGGLARSGKLQKNIFFMPPLTERYSVHCGSTSKWVQLLIFYPSKLYFCHFVCLHLSHSLNRSTAAAQSHCPLFGRIVRSSAWRLFDSFRLLNPYLYTSLVSAHKLGLWSAGIYLKADISLFKWSVPDGSKNIHIRHEPTNVQGDPKQLSQVIFLWRAYK